MSIKKIIKVVIDEQIRKKYKHILVPPLQFARITRRSEDVTVGIYNVKIVDPAYNDIPDYSEIPNIKASLGFDNGDIVILAHISDVFKIIAKVV